MSDEAPRILIVDPDRRHRRVLEVSLCKVGFEAVGVATGKEAVAYLQTCVPALIMAEIDLPDLSGFELCKRVRSQPSTEEVPIFFLSKSGDMADKLRAFELGVDEFLIRPVYIKEIVARVGLALKRRENERIAEAEAHTITGDLRDVQLIDILQTIEDREKTGALRLERGTIRGTIYFENGQPLDARVGHLTGPQAVFRLFNWTEGQYTLKYITQIRRLRRIDESFTDLVLEGLKQTEDFSEATKEFEDLSACLRLDFSSLAKVLDNMPDQVVELLHLFDGRRTLQQVLDESPMSDLDAIQAIRRLAAQELFQVVAPEVRGEQDDFDSLDADPEAFRVPTFQSWLSGEDPAERARLEEEERRRKEEEQRRRKEEEEQLQQELDELAKLKEVAESQRLQAEAQRRLAEEQARQLDERQRLIRRRLAGELDTKMGRLAPDLSGLPSKVHGFVAEDTIPGVFPHDSLMPAPTLRETEKPKLSVAPSDMEAAFPELKQLRAERDQVESLRNQYEQERRQLRELQGKRRQLEEERLRFQREIEEERALLQREIDAAQKQEFETTLSREADAQQMKELEALRRQEIREAEERALAAQRQEEIEDDVWGQLEQAVEDRLLEDELDAETADEMEQGRDFEEEALAKAQAGLLEARQKYADERRRRELALRRAAQPSADQPTVTDRASLRQSAVEQARQRLIEPDEPAPEEKPTRKRIPTHPQQMEAIQEPIALADTPESLPSIPQASLGKYAKARKREQGPPVGLSSAEIPASRAVQQQQALRPEPIRIIGESEPPLERSPRTIKPATTADAEGDLDEDFDAFFKDDDDALSDLYLATRASSNKKRLLFGGIGAVIVLAVLLPILLSSDESDEAAENAENTLSDEPDQPSTEEVANTVRGAESVIHGGASTAAGESNEAGMATLMMELEDRLNAFELILSAPGWETLPEDAVAERDDDDEDDDNDERDRAREEREERERDEEERLARLEEEEEEEEEEEDRPNNDAALAIAEEFLDDEEYGEAAAYLREIVDNDPGNREAQFMLGDALYANGQPEDAIRHLQRAGNSAEALLTLYSAQDEANRSDDAEDTLRDYLERYPEHEYASWARTQLGE